MLTKSDLLSFRQCPRKLWLEKKRPDLLPTTAASRRAIDGAKVGEMAQRLLGPDARDLSFSDLSLQEAADSAKAALAALRCSAFEVPFVRDSVYIRSDIMQYDGNAYFISETKASTFPLKSDGQTPGKPKDHYLDDVAIQAWVTEDGGMVSGRVELSLLDNRWQYPGDDNYQGVFRALDVSDLIKDRIAEVPRWAEGARRVVEGDMPVITTGAQCGKPYECPFLGFCAALEPRPDDHPIELLPGPAGKSLARRLRKEKGYSSILQPAPEELDGEDGDLYKRVQQAHREGRTIVNPNARDVIAQYPYPRFFLDFEGIDLPIPRWRGVRPYQQVPFQWSCHIEDPPGTFAHFEFLDLTGDDPSEACARGLDDSLAGDGPVFVYNATYERTRLIELADRIPEYRASMNGIAGRLVDLLPLVRDGFYHPSMRGSFSIKSVLPVVAPDLRYEDLIEVIDGTAAQIVYMQCIFEDLSDARRREIDANLRRYCRQDTWAMVEVAYRLEGKERPRRPVEG